jgi:hypothetical protein
MPNVEAAEDSDLRHFKAPPTTMMAEMPLHAPHQPSDATLIELMCFPFGGGSQRRANQWKL